MGTVLIVADADRIGELTLALTGQPAAVVVSSGGDDTIDLFAAHRPHVVVVTASLDAGDTKALIDALRGMAPRAEVAIVVVGDDAGPIRSPLDAGELAPDKFVTRPLAAKALRFAVAAAYEAVELARGAAPSPAPGHVDDDPTAAQQRAKMRARWEALADSFVEVDDEPGDGDEPARLPPVTAAALAHHPEPVSRDVAPPQAWRPGTTDELEAPTREPTLILRDPVPSASDVGTMSREPAPRPLDEGLEAFIDEQLDDEPTRARSPSPPATTELGAAVDGRDFARQLRAKMSMMAQRLFQGTGADPAQSRAVDLGPRHDHHTEIDLASLGEEQALGGGVTEIESREPQRSAVEVTTSPGSWDTSVRERGLPDHGEIVRGVSDVAMLLARMFGQGATGRVGFRRDAIEVVVYFDQGRPVFASSSEPTDRMGELLVREGKITAAQYERCQAVVAESGRRMGEILVDFGYLKRRELLPAVRRHVEDLVYGLFGWDHGTYRVMFEEVPSAERIRLSRHPAALILEGVRRKYDRSTLERLVGPPSTVIEVGDRDRLGGVINIGDLAAEERAAIAAFDGQADLAAVAATAGVDVADLLPIAWGLCALGLATARRTDTEVPDETSALFGETDLAIDRERVRARSQLVAEADYFALLGVRRDATAFEIRRAYQSARRDFAVEAFPSDLRRELAQELDDIAHVLDEAFRVLRDDRLRLTYLSNLFE